MFSDSPYNQIGEYTGTAFPLTVSSKASKIVIGHVLDAVSGKSFDKACARNQPKKILLRKKAGILFAVFCAFVA